MDKLSLSSLVIEVTRRCNMECEHCMRGEPQNMNLKEEYLEQMFSKLRYISCISFSGGEPTLAPEVMDQTLEIAAKHSVEVGSFYVVTNGLVVQDAFLLAILKWHNYCSENEISGVAVSDDSYHSDLAEQADKLEAFSFFSHRSDPLADSKLIISEGRAENWGGLHRSTDQFCVDEEGYISEGDIYLNCKGNIVAGCDFSYSSQDKHTVCSAKDFSPALLPRF